MNLAIDIGNTRVKVGLFAKNKLVKSYVYDSFTEPVLKTILKENPEIKASILCTVREYPAAIKKILTNYTDFIELNYTTPVPVKMGYKTPQTLGMDRLAAVCGAQAISKKGNILVINAGTCITVDFLDNKRIYNGGSISPGLEMRFKALHTFTGKLPLIAPDMKFKKLTGKDTTESIRAGVQLGMIREVEGMISEYRSKYKGLTVILTGGSAPWLLKSLKSKIKAEPFLVLTGLNVILSLFRNQGNHTSANRF